MRLYSRAFVKALRREGRFPRRPFTLRAANGELRWGWFRFLIPLGLWAYGAGVGPLPLSALVLWGSFYMFLRAMQLSPGNDEPLLLLPVADRALLRFRFDTMVRESLWFFADAIAVLVLHKPGFGTAIGCAGVTWATVVAGALLLCRLASPGLLGLLSLLPGGVLVFLLFQSTMLGLQPMAERLGTAATVLSPVGWGIGLFYNGWGLLPFIGVGLWVGSAPWIYRNLEANFHPNLEPPPPSPEPAPVQEDAPGWLERQFARWLSPRESLIWRNLFCTYPRHWSRTFRNTALVFLGIPLLVAGVDALMLDIGWAIIALTLVPAAFALYIPRIKESRPVDPFHLLPVGVRELRVVFAKEMLARNVAAFPILLLVTAYLLWRGGVPFTPMPAVVAAAFIYAMRPFASLHQTLRGARRLALVEYLMAVVTLIGFVFILYHGCKGQWLVALGGCGALGGILWVQEHFLLRRYERCGFDLIR